MPITSERKRDGRIDKSRNRIAESAQQCSLEHPGADVNTQDVAIRPNPLRDRDRRESGAGTGVEHAIACPQRRGATSCSAYRLCTIVRVFCRARLKDLAMCCGSFTVEWILPCVAARRLSYSAHQQQQDGGADKSKPRSTQAAEPVGEEDEHSSSVAPVVKCVILAITMTAFALLCATMSVALGAIYMVAAGASQRYILVNAAALTAGEIAASVISRMRVRGRTFAGASTFAIGLLLLATALFGVHIDGHPGGFASRASRCNRV